MSTTITGKLSDDARQFEAGQSTGFNVRIGVQYYDRKTKEKGWTNYQAVLFAKAGAQIQFYQSALVKDAVIELTCEKEKIAEYNGKYYIEMIDTKLGFVSSTTPVSNFKAASEYRIDPAQ